MTRLLDLLKAKPSWHILYSYIDFCIGEGPDYRPFKKMKVFEVPAFEGFLFTLGFLLAVFFFALSSFQWII